MSVKFYIVPTVIEFTTYLFPIILNLIQVYDYLLLHIPIRNICICNFVHISELNNNFK